MAGERGSNWSFGVRNGDTNCCLLESDTVVCTVSYHSDMFTVFLKEFNEKSLVIWRHACKNRALINNLAQQLLTSWLVSVIHKVPQHKPVNSHAVGIVLFNLNKLLFYVCKLVRTALVRELVVWVRILIVWSCLCWWREQAFIFVTSTTLCYLDGLFCWYHPWCWNFLSLSLFKMPVDHFLIVLVILNWVSIN